MGGSGMFAEAERRLVQPAGPGGFGQAEIDGLPEPVCRHLRHAIAPGAPLARSVRLEMRGRIKVGRWLPFRAREVLCPHRGFLWAARAGGVISGWDRYLDGVGGMRWTLAGLVPVARGGGPDVSRSAAGRTAGEAIWLPTALLPRFGVRWQAEGPDRVSLHYVLDGTPVSVSYRLDPAGRIRSLELDRWGDPGGTGTWAGTGSAVRSPATAASGV